MEVPRDRMKPISIEEAAALRERALAGDEGAAQEMVASVARMIHRIARRFEDPEFPDSSDYEDRVQRAIVRLLDHGIASYCPDMGYQWATYAWHVVHNEMKTAFNQTRSSRKREQAFRERAVVDNPWAGVDRCDPSEEVDRLDEAEWVRGRLKVLPKRYRQIVEARYGLDGGHCRTIREIGEEFGVTKQRVHQIMRCAYRRLKQSCVERGVSWPD